jgi:hypothetical protein
MRCTPLTFCCTVAPQFFNTTYFKVSATYNYTRYDGITPRFAVSTTIATELGITQFGGEKPAYTSPPTMICECSSDPPAFRSVASFKCSPKVQDMVLRLFPALNSSAATAELGSVSFLYVSLKPIALSFPSGIGYASPIEQTRNITILSWVNDTKHPTTSRFRSAVSSVPKLTSLLQR